MEFLGASGRSPSACRYSKRAFVAFLLDYYLLKFVMNICSQVAQRPTSDCSNQFHHLT
jgi:hypothetical protein